MNKRISLNFKIFDFVSFFFCFCFVLLFGKIIRKKKKKHGLDLILVRYLYFCAKKIKSLESLFNEYKNKIPLNAFYFYAVIFFRQIIHWKRNRIKCMLFIILFLLQRFENFFIKHKMD